MNSRVFILSDFGSSESSNMTITVSTAATISDIGLASGRVYRVGDRAIIVRNDKIAAINDEGVLFQAMDFEPAPGGWGKVDPYFVHDNGDDTMNVYFRLTGPSLPLNHSDLYVTLDADTGAKIGSTQTLPYSQSGSLANLGHTNSGRASGQMLQQAVSLSDGTIAVVDTANVLNKFVLKIVNPDGTGIALSAVLGDAILNHNSQLLVDLTEVGNKVLVAWTNYAPGQSGPPVHLQLVNKDGSFFGSEITIGNATSTPFGATPAVQVETMTDGRILVVWTEAGTSSGPDTDQSSTWFSILNADGAQSVGATLVNSEVTAGREDTPLVVITESGFVIGYSVLDFAGIQEGRLKQYDANGTLLDTQTGAYLWGSDDIIRTDNNSAFVVGGNVFEIALPGDDTSLDSGSGSGLPVTGTNAAEDVVGTPMAEIINALDGGDWITPGGGSDTVDGGDGNDMLSFFNLAETPGRSNVQYRLDIDMGAGRAVSHDGGENISFTNVERLTATIFADWIRGSDGDDEIRGLGDYDWIIATEGRDTIDGGTGQDMISFLEYQSSATNVIGSIFDSNGLPPTGAQASGVLMNLADPSGNTGLAAGLDLTSVERVTGSGRQDVFFGDSGQNDFRGLGDFDWFVSSTGGRERYFGGDGLDTVTYFNATAGIKASLSNGAMVGGRETGFGYGGDAARDLFFELENIVGSRFDDEIRGSSERNQLNGLEGDDMIFGKGGTDYIMGGLGNDTIDGGAGSDYALFSGDSADYTLTRSGSNVTVVGADGNDNLVDVEYFRFDDGDVTIWSL
ncbi:hypothetical protein KMP95_15840 [Ruegeria litorea]|nr:hypothetical protein [Falsiruegeria litorea]